MLARAVMNGGNILIWCQSKISSAQTTRAYKHFFDKFPQGQKLSSHVIFSFKISSLHYFLPNQNSYFEVILL
jgi:hypothetical protein